MIFLICLLLALAILAVSLYKVIPKIEERSDIDNLGEDKRFWKAFIIPLIILVFGIFNPFSLERVDAGHVGIKVNLTGDSRGISRYEYKTGWVIINNWTSRLYEFPTFQQHIDYEPQAVITKGGFSATIKPSFNYSLKSGDIGDMFSNLRLDVKQIEQQWLQTAIVGTVNDVANKWTVDDIFNHREQFESDIIAEANRRVSKWFIVSQLRTNITPPPALTKSIEAKTQAIQQVQVAENQTRVAIAEGDRKIATARADSAAAVIAASGEAESIRRKQIVLNSEYIEYLKVQQWDGKLPQVQSSGSGVLMNLK